MYDTNDYAYSPIVLFFNPERHELAGGIYITRNGPAQARVMMKSVLSSAEHGRCPHKY